MAQTGPDDYLGRLIDMAACEPGAVELNPSAVAKAKEQLMELRRDLAVAALSSEMACQAPPDDCDCPGCHFADAYHAGMLK
jgi:hypothetical protein